MKVIISGGGTGGHIFPAIAVAQALKAGDASIEILFVGALGRMEMDRVPKSGFDIIGLPVSGFQRKLSLRNLMFPIRLAASLWKAHRIVRRFRPDVIVGFGGYASGPVAKAGAWNRVPLVLQEQNSFAGVTNRLLARRAEKICVAYEGMERFFDPEKIELTGNPVREDIEFNKSIKEESHEYFGLVQNKKTILIFGGSLGARTLNEAVRHNIHKLGERADLQFIWQVGKYYYEEYKSLEEVRRDNVRLLPFIDRMDMAYTAADLVVCRAGALTISELCLAGKPAILVPSPNVAEDHQTKNALSLAEREAAWIVKDREAVEQLGDQILRIIDEPAKLEEVGRNCRGLARTEAARSIAEIVKSVAGQPEAGK